MNIDIGQLEFIDKTLRLILVDIEAHTGLEFTITSLYRMNDGGVHGTLPLRGVDLRMRDESIGHELEKYINFKWMYSVEIGKQCALLHGRGFNLHLHIQTHKDTRLRG